MTAVERAQRLVTQLDQCQIYGPADAVRDAARQLVTVVAELELAATQVVSSADDTGCTDDLTVVSKFAVDELQAALDGEE